MGMNRQDGNWSQSIIYLNWVGDDVALLNDDGSKIPRNAWPAVVSLGQKES